MKLLNLIQENNESVIKEGNTLQTMFKTVADAKTLKSVNPSLFKTLEDVIKFGKAEGKPIEGYTAANKTNRTAINNVDELVYSIKAGGMTAEAMGQFYKGMLKSANTPRNLINEIVPEIIADKKFINTYGKMTPLQMEKELRNRKYSEAAIEEIMGKVKKDPNWKNTRKIGTAERKAKKTKSGKDTTLEPSTNGSNVPPQETKKLSERIAELGANIKKMSWKQLVAWAAGIGVSIGALWWWLYNNSDTIPDDTPVKEPIVSGEWAPCIQELIKSGEGTVGTSQSGQVSVTVITSEYPKGLYFYSNGRVMDAATKKMGKWKCKDAKPVIAESKKMSMVGILEEQSSEVDVATMSGYVDTAVDDLDGFVDTDNLNSLLSILKSLNGKTFQGKNAISEFLSLYKEDEGGDDFIADVNNVGVKTLGTQAILAKRQVISLAQGGGTTKTNTNPSDKLGLSHIDIVWDGEAAKTGGEGGKPTPKKKSTNYHDCSNKDFPFEFGCIAPKIAEIQGCLGVTPQKGYFGPKTLAALKEKGFIDSSNTITKETYDKVSAICSDKGTETKKRDLSTEPIKTLKSKEIQPIKIGGDLSKLPNIQPTDAMNGQKIYEALSANYGDGSNPEYPYIFQEGGRIKYKGDGLNQETLNALNQFISSMGYTFMKQKAKEDYGMKYVWVKQ